MTHYTLDRSASRFTVRAFSTGLLSALGHNPTIAIRDFSGDADFDPAAPERSSLRLSIRADSLEVTDDLKAKDRLEMEGTMKQKVLESAKFPAISFESTAASANRVADNRFQINLNGSLSLRGATGAVSVPAQVALLGDRLRASGEFSLRQSDYGIPPVSVAGGALKLRDELKFAFDIVAQKQG